MGTSFCVPSTPHLANQGSDEPHLLLWNEWLAARLNIPLEKQDAGQLLSGQTVLEGASPVALAYSGHQFGHFNPTLGDGRAHLIGSFDDALGNSFDLQLKGSGATAFSRGGDGLCALGPAVREFVMSQAMRALGVPTTDCLAVVATGQQVYRNTMLPGAVVCRVASSHIRVGSFQYLALHQDIDGLHKLMEMAIARYYPHITEQGDERVLAFLKVVCEQQITLMIHWLRVGFIHGVMNTDNTLVGGETIDYGPCAMLESFSFEQVFSSIDKQGRYAFGQQPQIASWNCARLAESLIGLMEAEESQAVTQLSDVLTVFSHSFNKQYQAMWASKLGILAWQEEDNALLSELLSTMKANQLDYTNTFAALTNSLLEHPMACFSIPETLNAWYQKWLRRIAEFERNLVLQTMQSANPTLIPRNGLMEQVIADYYKEGKSDLLTQWLPLLNDPYKYQELAAFYTTSSDNEDNYQTFCGT
ncbi:YdiU family protein [Pseudoalteromonas sp. S16_S37]|nr:YdiU family protein [Pseudoalteromonas sp. S16_S37]